MEGESELFHRHLLLPVERVGEDRPEVSLYSVAIQKALPSPKTNRAPGPISAMPQELLHDDDV